MTKLFFRYTGYYDHILAQLAGEEFSKSHEERGIRFTREVSKYWDQYNDRVFAYYKKFGLVLPEFWFAYPVHPWKGLIPFDDPLTIFVRDDLDNVVATIIHELCHVFFGYCENVKICNRIWNHIVETFSEEDETTKKHLAVIPLAAGALGDIFSTKKADELLAQEKCYEGLVRAWEIIDVQKGKFYENPIDFILRLSSQSDKTPRTIENQQ